MSSAEFGLPSMPCQVESVEIISADFGGFSPETEAGGWLMRHLGRLGMFGRMLADGLTAAAKTQASDVETIRAYETELTGPDIPGTRKFDPNPPGIDSRILAAVNLEAVSRVRGDEGAAGQANEALTNTYLRMVEEGTDPVRYWLLVNQARRHVSSQLN